MPNWCFTTMVVYGDSTELKDFRSRLLKAKAKAEKKGTWDNYEILQEFGFTAKEMDNRYIRGTIDCYGDIERLNALEGQYSFQIDYSSAWSPMIEAFDYLLSKNYKSLKQVSISEEPGLEIYINTDTDHLFFTTKFHAYCSHSEEDEYFDTEQELCEWMNALILELKEHIPPVETFKDCLKAANLIESSKEDFFCSISRYE